MQTAKAANRRLIFSLLGQNLCLLLIGYALLIPAGHCWAQAGRGTAQGQSPDLVEALERDNIDDFDLEKIAKAQDLQAIPLLEDIFQRRRSHTLSVRALQSKLPSTLSHGDSRFETEWLNLENELHIASVLVRLGVKDDVYWNYLAEQVQAILELNIPFPWETDAQEGPNPPTSPKFVAWAKSRNLDQNTAFMYEVMKMPGPVLLMAATDDPRGIPLLRQGLKSANPMIQMLSAKGLAQLRDKESVPLIIAACKKASASERNALAESLLYFDDPQAQTYAALNLPKKNYAAVRQRIAQGHTPFN
jgi:hypothetical protein